MHIRNTSAVALLVTALALTGCAASGGSSRGVEKATSDLSTAPESEATSAEELDADPATGETVSGTGYTMVTPQGWGMPAGGLPGFSPDAFAANLQDADGFADNLNVILAPGPFTPEEVESSGVAELEATADEVVVKERVLIADTEAVHVSASITDAGTTYVIEQYYLSTEEEGYVATFGFSETVPEAERVALAESVLVTWEWS
ncbi:hypothetical protein [Microbacterium sp. 179-I 3D4 NHS]|uniref:hypothetical protein n=1 Tax=Microbacterium sp. 179-I 3D4 NHS TaxID=3142381 RepID=UPI0039A1B1EA